MSAPRGCGHPLTVLPAVSVVLVIPTAAWLVTSSPPPMPAWVLFGLAVTFCATSAILLATLWLLGGACRGVEGPPRTRAGHPVASNPSLPFAADVLALPAGSSIGPGTIAMSVSPGRKKGLHQRELGPDMARIRAPIGADVVVTMLEQTEMGRMGCDGMAAAAAVEGLGWIGYPVRDKWIPEDSQTFINDVVRPIIGHLKAGKRVLVHCNGGKGRTGTAVAAVLMTGAGGRHSLGSAIAAMRAARPGMLRNPLQQMYLVYLRRTLATIH